MSLAKSPSLGVTAAVLTLLLARVIYFYCSADALLIAVIPDDAFYYIQLARHRATDGFWTFDGVSPATGFHFLYAYFLVALFSTFGDIGWRELYAVVAFVASISIALSALFTFRTVETVLDRKMIPIAAIPFFSWEVLVQSTAMVESWMVLLFAGLTAYSLAKDKRPTAYSATGLITLGILGSLARTDFGIWPGVLFCVFLVYTTLRREKNNALARSALILTGSVIGVTIVLLHNHYIAGHFVPASAQVKLHWSVVEGHDIWKPVSLIAPILLTHLASVDSALGYAVIILWSVTLPFLVRAVLTSESQRHSNSTPALALVTGSVFTILAYIVLYRHNSASLQIWYASNFVVPIAVSFAFIAHFFVTVRTFVFAIVSLAYFVVGASNVSAVVWPWQAGMLQAGLFLKGQAPQSNYASWNAGIISYFSEKPIINIDGLTNDDVLPFIESNTLLDYVKSRGVDYIVDYEIMIRGRRFRARGGYDEARTNACLRPIQSVDDNAPPGWLGTRMIFIEVVPGCL